MPIPSPSCFVERNTPLSPMLVSVAKLFFSDIERECFPDAVVLKTAERSTKRSSGTSLHASQAFSRVFPNSTASSFLSIKISSGISAFTEKEILFLYAISE